jgi:hypothetical protein
LWDRKTGKVQRVFRGHDSYVKAVAFGPGGRQVLSGGTDATVRLWDLASGKQRRVFRKHGEPLVAVAFLGDGRQTISGSRDGVVRLWTLGKAVVVKPPKETRPPDPEPVKVRKPLRPAATISVGGTVGSLFLSPDRGALYFLNLTDGVVGRIDTKTYRRTLLRLAKGTETLALSRDGKWLVATARLKGERPRSRVQVIDPVKLVLRRSFTVPVAAYDLAVSERGLAFVSGATGDWAEVSVIDLGKEKVAATWGGVWTRSLLQLTPDGRRLYVSSQGVVPGTLDALPVPARLADRPTLSRAPGHDKQALGGAFVISPDGRYLLCKTGTILRLSAERDEDMKPHRKLEPFLAAVADVEGKVAYLLGRDGLLEQYGYPEFRLKGTRRLSLSGYQLALDGKGGRLYVAGFDPAALSERPRARGHGDIHVYRLKDLVEAK